MAALALAEAGKTRVGWVGVGVMGRWMCQHIMSKGFNVSVYSRTKGKAQVLLDQGANWCESPKAVAAASDVVFTMVGVPADVRECYFGEQGILAGARANSILVDMTTTAPSLAQQIYAAAKEKGASAIDAPVSGGDIGAREARLSIMVGGDEGAVKAVMPLFEAMGQRIVHQGAAGNGQHTKMCNQILLVQSTIGMCEALIYGHKAGLDLEVMMSSVGKGAAACWVLDNLAPRILRRDFEPGFFVEHLIKDLKIALEEAQTMNLCLPGLSLVSQLYMSVVANGGARRGSQSLMLALEQLNGVTVTKRA